MHRIHANLGHVLAGIAEAKVPVATVLFPDSLEDGGAVYDAISASLPLPCVRERFVEAHARVADPDLVHVK